MNFDYTIYTDGSCLGNGKGKSVGGWAFVILRDGQIVDRGSGGAKDTTNQRMELTAALEACRALCKLDKAFSAELLSDSAYLINCRNQHWYRSWIRNGWQNSKKQPVANKDLWESLIEYFNNDRDVFSFKKVAGHAGVEYNELVDKMAVAESERMKNA